MTACRVEILNQQYANECTEAMFSHFHLLPFVQFQRIKQASYNFCQDRINSFSSHVQCRVAFGISQNSSKDKPFRCSHFQQFICFKYLKCYFFLLNQCICIFQQIHFCCFTLQGSSFFTSVMGYLWNQNLYSNSAKLAYTFVLVILQVIIRIFLALFCMYFSYITFHSINITTIGNSKQFTQLV